MKFHVQSQLWCFTEWGFPSLFSDLYSKVQVQICLYVVFAKQPLLANHVIFLNSSSEHLKRMGVRLSTAPSIL